MPDNITLSTGEIVRTLEDTNAVHHPISIQAYVTSVGTPDVISIPTAAALGDNTANPTTVLYGSCLLAYDGSTWDRVRGDSTDGLLVNLGSNNDVVCTNAGTFAVQAAQSGTWNITNVSGTVSLPTGASTSAKQDTIIGHVDGIEALLTTIDADTSALAGAVSGSEVQVDVVTSALPTGASTAAKQPALGTAGTASADVITVQGIASMTALKVDGSAVTQPVSLTSTTVTGTVAVTQSGTWDEVGINDSGNSITVDAPVGTPVFVRLSDGASAISTLPVSLASVPSHAVTNAGTFAVQAAQSGTWTVDLGATDNAVLDTIASPVATISATPLQRVAIFDAADAQITSFGGGTEYTEDAAAAANPVGKAMILVRADALAGVTTTDGDNVAARGTDKGEVYVKHADSIAVTSATLSTAANQTTIIGHVDGIETLLGTIDADTSTLAGAVSGTEMQVDIVTSALPSGAATSAKQDTIIGHVDGIEGLLTTIDADTGNLAGILTAVQTIDNCISGTGVNVSQMNGVAVTMGNGASGTGVQRVTIANDSTGTLGTVSNVTTVATVTSLTGSGLAHDEIDSGNPHKIGMRAIAHGTNPTAVAAADRTHLYANRAGIPFVIGGHPNVITHSVRVLDSDGAQTNIAMVTVGSGAKIVVTRVSCKADGSNTGPTNITVGFAAATLSTPNTTTAGSGILADFLGVPPGGGAVEGNGSGILGVGADGEDLRYTAEDPVGGAITITVSYYTIES